MKRSLLSILLIFCIFNLAANDINIYPIGWGDNFSNKYAENMNAEFRNIYKNSAIDTVGLTVTEFDSGKILENDKLIIYIYDEGYINIFNNKYYIESEYFIVTHFLLPKEMDFHKEDFEVDYTDEGNPKLYFKSNNNDKIFAPSKIQFYDPNSTIKHITFESNLAFSAPFYITGVTPVKELPIRCNKGFHFGYSSNQSIVFHVSQYRDGKRILPMILQEK